MEMLRKCIVGLVCFVVFAILSPLLLLGALGYCFYELTLRFGEEFLGWKPNESADA